MLKKIKDNAFSKSAKFAINTKIKDYGKMLKFNLDSKTKSIDIEVLLEGEKEPLTVHIQHYAIDQEGEDYFLKVKGISTSRAWVNTLVSTRLEDKPFKIPSEYAKMLKMIV